MTSRRRLPAALALLAVLAVSACTSRPEAAGPSRTRSPSGVASTPPVATTPPAPSAAPSAPTSGSGPAAAAAPGAARVSAGFPTAGTAYPTVPAGLPELGPIPVATGTAAYRRGLAVAGGDGGAVTDAVVVAAQVARVTLAGCARWATGALAPALPALLTPDQLARVQRDPGALLPGLPATDGAGHDLAALGRQGCDDSAVLRYPDGPLAVDADRTRLTVSGGFGLDVRLGGVLEHATRRWTLTLDRTPAGWQVAGAAAAGPVAWTPR